MSQRFADFELDLATHELRRQGESVHLTPKAYALLALLVRERPRALARQEILDEVWPDTAVGDGSLSVAVAEVRRSLGDSGVDERFVRTVRGFGYAFCDASALEKAVPANGVCRLVAWGLEQRWLHDGEYVVGRDPGCELQIDAASLSRRHARLSVAMPTAALEDLGSKNGSFLNGERLAAGSPRPVRDGDEMRLGSVVLSLLWRASAAPTETLGSTDLAPVDA